MEEGELISEISEGGRRVRDGRPRVLFALRIRHDGKERKEAVRS